MFILLTTLAVALAITSVIARLGGRRVPASCGMASALCAYADALAWNHSPLWQPAALVGAAVVFLILATVTAFTRGRPPAADHEVDHG